MPDEFWPNAWFATAVVVIALLPATAAIIADAVGLRRPRRPGDEPAESRGPVRRVVDVAWLAVSWALLSWTGAAISGVIGTAAFSGPDGDPVHTGTVTAVESCSRYPGALWLAHRCDLWAEVATPEAHDLERFHTIVIAEHPIAPGDPIGLWPGDPNRNGRAPWDLHPLDATERPYLRPGQESAAMAAPALAAAGMLVWALRRPLRLGAGTGLFDQWGRGGS